MDRRYEIGIKVTSFRGLFLRDGSISYLIRRCNQAKNTDLSIVVKRD